MNVSLLRNISGRPPRFFIDLFAAMSLKNNNRQLRKENAD